MEQDISVRKWADWFHQARLSQFVRSCWEDWRCHVRRREIIAGRVVTVDGEDVTDAYQAGAQLALKLAKQAGCQTAILKARSPSCGCGKIYDGSFSGRLIPGDGVFAALLKTAGIVVQTEEEIIRDE